MYSTYFEDEFVQVYDLEDCIRAIRCRNKDNEDKIKYLEEENARLKNEHYKDKELQKMKEELNKMHKNYLRGFPIDEKEWESIKKWREEHDRKVHGYKDGVWRKCGGGAYSYHFTPSSLGSSGVIRCTCGAEFEFQEIG